MSNAIAAMFVCLLAHQILFTAYTWRHDKWARTGWFFRGSDLCFLGHWQHPTSRRRRRSKIDLRSSCFRPKVLINFLNTLAKGLIADAHSPLHRPHVTVVSEKVPLSVNLLLWLVSLVEVVAQKYIYMPMMQKFIKLLIKCLTSFVYKQLWI